MGGQAKTNHPLNRTHWAYDIAGGEQNWASAGLGGPPTVTIIAGELISSSDYTSGAFVSLINIIRLPGSTTPIMHNQTLVWGWQSHQARHSLGFSWSSFFVWRHFLERKVATTALCTPN